MSITWKESVKLALVRYSARNATLVVQRGKFIDQEINAITDDVQSVGRTPSQTVSRVLQELRDEGYLFFSTISGEYILNANSINAVAEDFPDDALENAVQRGSMKLYDVAAGSEVAIARMRKGMAALRKQTLMNYQGCCALCDINDAALLVTSHIARWADHPEARGMLANTICFCSLHDKLFEAGYFSMTDTAKILWKSNLGSDAIEIWKNECTGNFKSPVFKLPSAEFIKMHRMRVGMHGIYS